MLQAGTLNAMWSRPCGIAPPPRAFTLLFVKGAQAEGLICGRQQGYSPLRVFLKHKGRNTRVEILSVIWDQNRTLRQILVCGLIPPQE